MCVFDDRRVSGAGVGGTSRRREGPRDLLTRTKRHELGEAEGVARGHVLVLLQEPHLALTAREAVEVRAVVRAEGLEEVQRPSNHRQIEDTSDSSFHFVG